MFIIETFLLALALSVDSFVVSMGGSVTLGHPTTGKVLRLSASFGIIQALFLFAGWVAGDFFYGHLQNVAAFIGVALLVYVGLNMIWGAFSGKDEKVNLDGAKNIIISAAATSIDALAVGVSMAMASTAIMEILVTCVFTLIITSVCCVAGIFCGSALGRRFGKWAVVGGGVVLLGFAVRIAVSALA